MANIEDDGRTQAWDGVPDPLTFAQIHKKIEAFSLSYIKESSKKNFLKIRNMFKTQTVRSIQKVQQKRKYLATPTISLGNQDQVYIPFGCTAAIIKHGKLFNHLHLNISKRQRETDHVLAKWAEP